MTATTYISLESLALRLSLPKAYMKRLVKAGKLPFIDMGNGRKRFNESQVRKALERLAATGGKSHKVGFRQSVVGANR